MIDALLSTVAPHICSGCQEYGTVLCKSCIDDINNDDFGRCVWCLRPTVHMHQCGACTRKLKTAGAWVVGERAGVLKRLLNDYKFESHREAATALALLLDAAIPVLSTDTVVTWVPTAPAHTRQRGFDHAARLARVFAVLRGLPCQSLLIRQRGGSQHELGKKAREAAAAHAFRLKQAPHQPQILLIDDILTTGATMKACVGLLRAAGTDVSVAVVARQPQ